ncbi:MAG: hypothetical protein FJ138_12775, partial [Deltaproteobacteria bacterium]|nr:hypothetical protein [Deltaproteobacteria bacterium]
MVLKSEKPKAARRVALALCWAALSACSAAPPPAPPAPPDPDWVAAEVAFERGDWEALGRHVRELTPSGPHGARVQLFHALLLGLQQPKVGLDALRALEGAGRPEDRELCALLQATFTALRGDCLLSEGPLRALHLPKAASHGEGARGLMRRALDGCEARRAEGAQRLITASVVQRPPAPPLPPPPLRAPAAPAAPAEPIEIAEPIAPAAP